MKEKRLSKKLLGNRGPIIRGTHTRKVLNDIEKWFIVSYLLTLVYRHTDDGDRQTH